MADNSVTDIGQPTELRGAALLAHLRAAFARPLPGPRAQMLMAPGYRVREMARSPRTSDPADMPEYTGASGSGPPYRHAAVLILLHPVGNSLCFPLIRRPETMRHHRGQIGLPGGGIERGESHREAAIRETREELGEELGIVLHQSSVIGDLSPLAVPHSGYIIHPSVAYSPSIPEYHLQETEVAGLFEARLDILLDPAHHRVETRRFSDGPWPVPYYAFDEDKVWGATAMILSEFVFMLGPRPEA